VRGHSGLALAKPCATLECPQLSSDNETERNESLLERIPKFGFQFFKQI